MLVTLWVFIGIEGASVYSARAAKRSDVGRATVLGFAAALALYVLVSLLATGILTQPELAGLKVPSMGAVLESIVGSWGAELISIGLIVSASGAFLSWTLLCAEIPYTCGRDGTFPRWFAAENVNGSPKNALWATNVLIQLFLVLSFFSKSAYQFFYLIASAAILPSYVLSGAYALKVALCRDGYRSGDPRIRDIVIGAAATIYGLWLVYAAGVHYLLMCAVLFASGIPVYVKARRERGVRAFTGPETALAVGIGVVAVVAAVLMSIGKVSPF
jgi:arginine:ornithine antiporter/lysine permease